MLRDANCSLERFITQTPALEILNDKALPFDRV